MKQTALFVALLASASAFAPASRCVSVAYYYFGGLLYARDAVCFVKYSQRYVVSTNGSKWDLFFIVMGVELVATKEP